jgi:hypothetical protein
MPMILATFCNNVIQRLKEEKSTEHFTAKLCWNLFAHLDRNKRLGIEL